jgi:hypothetical protein
MQAAKLLWSAPGQQQMSAETVIWDRARQATVETACTAVAALLKVSAACATQAM